MYRYPILFLSCLSLAACGTAKPKIMQMDRNTDTITLTSGMATQVELPDESHVKSARTGKPSLVEAEMDDNVVTLIPKEGTGETNMIVRYLDEDKDEHAYQYHIIVQPPR